MGELLNDQKFEYSVVDYEEKYFQIIADIESECFGKEAWPRWFLKEQLNHTDTSYCSLAIIKPKNDDAHANAIVVGFCIYEFKKYNTSSFDFDDSDMDMCSRIKKPIISNNSNNSNNETESDEYVYIMNLGVIPKFRKCKIGQSLLSDIFTKSQLNFKLNMEQENQKEDNDEVVDEKKLKLLRSQQPSSILSFFLHVKTTNHPAISLYKKNQFENVDDILINIYCGNGNHTGCINDPETDECINEDHNGQLMRKVIKLDK
jgi:ribosomal protein S18 acetylase RimI-like enzyme